MGRPSTFNDKVATTICQRIAGGESLRTICKDKDMPSIAAVQDWLSKRKEFAEHYARAREDQADTLAEEILDVARQEPGQTEHGVDAGDVAHRRLLIDALKWRAGKLRPKVYGDKVQQEHSGPGGAPIQVVTGVPGLPFLEPG